MTLCTYSLDRYSSIEIIDIVANHRFALIKREGIWEKIESPKRKKVEEEAIKTTKNAEANLNEVYNHLEESVKERTMQLQKAYEQLVESERDLAEAQKMTHIGNWKWNIETNELYWSDEVYRIFGFNSQEFKVTYDSFFNFVQPMIEISLLTPLRKVLVGILILLIIESS